MVASPGSGDVETVRVAAVQLTAGPDRDQNLATADRLVRAGAEAGASLVVLPEYTSVMGPGEVLKAGAEPLDGPTTTWARALAAELGLWLLAGSFPERRADGRTANTATVIAPSGELVARYRKVHLFDCDVPGAEFHESAAVEPGDELVTVPLDGLTLGLSTCYDLRFPELYRILALRGATALAVPAAFTARTGPPHWAVLLRARAIENQCFVIAAGQTGASAPHLRWHGQSMIIDPWGDVLAEAPASADEVRETVIWADLDLGRLREVRSSLPSLANRRPDAYTWPA